MKMFKSCALVLLSCAILVVGLSSLALSHFHKTGDVQSLVFEESETCAVSKALRRETIRALPGDRRWTREACAEHWAEGIDKVAHAKLAKKRIFLAMNMKNNSEGMSECWHVQMLQRRFLRQRNYGGR